MKIWRLDAKRYYNLWQHFKSKQRHPVKERYPWETDQEFRERIFIENNTQPIHIDYWTKRGLVRFVPKAR